MTKLVHGQQTATTQHGGTDDCVKASFIAAQVTANNMKSFGNGDFIKDCILHAAQCVFPKTVNDVKRISLLRNAVIRRVEGLFCNIESGLIEKLRTCVFYSLALDESADQADTTQLFLFGELIIITIYLKNFSA